MTPGKPYNKSELLPKHAPLPKTALLAYIGSIKGPTANFTIGVHVIMDSTIGLRYDIAFEVGQKVLSHIAFFYKFSNPYQMVYYNFLNHKTDVIKGGGSGKDPNLVVVGTEMIDSFSCTHLYEDKKHESQHYWMSTAVPGFYLMAIKLNNIDPGLELMAINQTIFNWGGLVRVKTTSIDNGQTTTLELNLAEANTHLVFQPSDFEVPH